MDQDALLQKLSGAKSTSGNSDEILKALRPDEHLTGTDKVDIANKINNSFLSPMAEFTPLNPEHYQDLLLAASNDSTVIIAAGKKLSTLNPKKAHGPDGIPTWVLKENAGLLELPVKRF